MAKRLTETQKDEITQGFKQGKTIDVLAREFNFTRLTIIRNLKIYLGDEKYEELKKANKKSIKKNTLREYQNIEEENIQKNKGVYKEEIQENKDSFQISNDEDSFQDSTFIEITPLDYEIDNVPQKELSSIPISEIELPNVAYIIVNKNIELEIKLLKDFPEWGFLPTDDLNRKSIEIFSELKLAKRACSKEQKVIKVPNTNVFRIASPILISRGISRIVSAEKLIAL